MHAEREGRRGARGPVRGVGMPLRGWALWRLPWAPRALVLVVTALALVLVLPAARLVPDSPADLLLFALLLGAAAGCVEASRHVPEPAGMNANDMLGAWWLAMAVLLPPVYVLVAPVPLMALTQWRVRRLAAYKRVYSAAVIGLAHAAGSLAWHALPLRVPPGHATRAGTVVAVLALLGIGLLAKGLNAVLVAVAVKTADPEAGPWSRVLVVDRGELELTEVCAGVLMAVAAAASPALVVVGLAPALLLQRGMLYAQLQTAARTDSKTGLLNAVVWEREAEVELAQARRRAQPAAVLLLDLDHFKLVNDTFGHLVGDQVLRAVADFLRASSRQGRDLVCRFGGEEFAVLLVGLDETEAPRAAERLRSGVAALATPAGGALVQVTVSVGVTVTRPGPGGADVAELLARADLALYEAKRQGRDRVSTVARPDRRAPA